MVCFGAVVVRPGLTDTFYGRCKPISDTWDPEALAISGFSREETMEFEDPRATMARFAAWIKEVNRGKRPRFISDNNGYDWKFIDWYFWEFLDDNPFGFSSANLGSLYKGLVKNDGKNFKHLRKTKHTHHPVDDAKGNAEALLHMKENMGFKIALE
jgi:hypothetical protein